MTARALALVSPPPPPPPSAPDTACMVPQAGRDLVFSLGADIRRVERVTSGPSTRTDKLAEAVADLLRIAEQALAAAEALS